MNKSAREAREERWPVLALDVPDLRHRVLAACVTPSEPQTSPRMAIASAEAAQPEGVMLSRN
jgi:hypothetical protein